MPVEVRKPNPRLDHFAHLLSLLPKGRLLDLACGQGVFSTLATALGWSATAVDVRTARMPMTSGISWVQADVRDFEIRPGEYDCIAILGLLYHLELKDQIDLLRRCAVAPTIIDTHFSLSPTHEELGYRGHTFDEVQGRSPEQHAAGNKSSWKNATAFWLDDESLTRLLQDCGYRAVYRLEPPYEKDRTFILATPAVDYSRAIGTAWRLVNEGGQGRARRRVLPVFKRVLRKLRSSGPGS